jgi:hypothetical protein
MKHERIDPNSRVWVVTLGPDGRLSEQLDPACLCNLDPTQAQEIADALLSDARSEIARTRVW